MPGEAFLCERGRFVIADRWVRAAVLLCLSVVLAACAPRPAAQRAAPVPDARIEQVYVATQRPLDRTGPAFGASREKGVNYFRASVSIPPGHVPGKVEWPDGPPDAATDFVVTRTQVYSSPAPFIREVKSHRVANETLLFVHGYNNTLSDAMYRMAQIQADFDTGMPSVLFSWASAGDPRGYIYDRDSVLYARDDLETVLRQLTSDRGDRVLLLAHSMGAHLVMEVMRQAALRGDRRLLSRISGVVLMSPDLDPDLFRRQAEAIGDLPQPFLIFVSQQDRVLTLASFITGQKPRLGVIDGPGAVAGLPVKVIDFTALGDGEGLNHAVPATSPAAISVLRGMIGQAQSGRSAFGNYMVLKAQP